MNDRWMDAVTEAIKVPHYIQACANACSYDLNYGPAWARIPYGNIENFTEDDFASLYEDMEDEAMPEVGDRIEEVYTGTVGKALRAFIEDLPVQAWVDMECSEYLTCEPATHWFDDNYTEEDSEDDPDVVEHDGMWGKWYEEDWSNIYELDHGDIVRALFGKTIAREFR